MGENFVPMEDFISTYPETQKVYEELDAKLQPVKEFLTSLIMKDGQPLIWEVRVTLEEPKTVLTSVSFNDSSFQEKSN